MQSFSQIRDAAIAARRKVQPAAKFAGTSNPRHLHVLRALLRGPHTREQLDRLAGVSNGPSLVAALRRRGLALPCTLVFKNGRNGRTVRHGVYFLTTVDICKIRDFLFGNAEEGK